MNLCTVNLWEQHIWLEIGESEEEKDHMLSELEKECMLVYQRKVDEARSARARLHQSLVAKEAELASLMAVLGEQSLQLKVLALFFSLFFLSLGYELEPYGIRKQFASAVDCLLIFCIQMEKSRSLKERLASVTPLLEDLRMNKEERVKQFSDILCQIEKLNADITGFSHRYDSLTMGVKIEEHDLSTRKLADYQAKLRSLQKEKLRDAIESLKNLWDLMDSSEEERRPFEKVATVLGSSEVDVMCSGLVDPSGLLANIETQIAKAKEESAMRKEIIDRINKWLLACEEENWLEDYDKVGNSASPPY
ncbi:hypothetical protein BHE74_00014641 [Ensete ventricosum]|nr:hypothetical protein BHE74_00014641 [Ensete ventricosum]